MAEPGDDSDYEVEEIEVVEEVEEEVEVTESDSEENHKDNNDSNNDDNNQINFDKKNLRKSVYITKKVAAPVDIRQEILLRASLPFRSKTVIVQNDDSIKTNNIEEKKEEIKEEIKENNNDDDFKILLESTKWEERKEGFIKLNEHIKNTENVSLYLDKYVNDIKLYLNNFKETNFNIIKVGMECLITLFNKINYRLDEMYLDLLLNGLYEKIADNKVHDTYIQLLNTLYECYSTEKVIEALLDILISKSNKNNVLKEYSIYLYKLIEEKTLNINNHNIKQIIDFYVKIANNPNNQLRISASKAICLLYKFIGPDIKLLINDIKESTLKNILKEIDSTNINETDLNNNIKKINIKSMFEPMDISQSLPPKLLKVIDKGEWQEKKEGIEFINLVIERANKKILPNGLEDLFELIQKKLTDKNQNLVKIILQLLNLLIESLGENINKFSMGFIDPLLSNLSDKNQQIRDECISCINELIKEQNFNIIALKIPQLLLNENNNMRREIVKLLINNINLINEHQNSFYNDLAKSLLICLQDKSAEVRNSTSEFISKFKNKITEDQYIKISDEFKPLIAEKLKTLIRNIFNENSCMDQKTLDNNHTNKFMKERTSSKDKTNNDSNKNAANKKPIYKKNIKINIPKFRRDYSSNHLTKKNQTIDAAPTSHKRFLNKNFSSRNLLKTNNNLINKIGLNKSLLKNEPKNFNKTNYSSNREIKTISSKSSLNNINLNTNSNKKQSIGSENNNEIKTKILTKNKIFLENYKIKSGAKEKRLENDKKNNFYFETQNFDNLSKIKEVVKNIFEFDLIKKLFSNDAKEISKGITPIINILSKIDLNYSNEDFLGKFIDNLDLLLKILGTQVSINQTPSLVKTFFSFSEELLRIYKEKNIVFNDTESNILLNIFSDKIVASVLFKEKSIKFIFQINDIIGADKTFTSLFHLIEYKNTKLKYELIEIIQKIYDNSPYEDHYNLLNKTVKNILRIYFGGDSKMKNKVYPFIIEAYTILGNDFTKISKFFPTKKQDELFSKLETGQRNIDNNKLNNTTRSKTPIKKSRSRDKSKNKSNKNENKSKKIDVNHKNEDFNKTINIEKNLLTEINKEKNKTQNKTNNLLTNETIIQKLNSLDLNNDIEIMDSLLDLYTLLYRDFKSNKAIIIKNADIIIEKFTELTNKLLPNKIQKIKLLKYVISILCKLSSLKELLSNISFNTQKNLIQTIFLFISYEDMVNFIKTDDGETIWKGFNSTMLHVIDYCSINENIIILIQLISKNLNNEKLVEYGSRCLLIINPTIKDKYNQLNICNVFKEIHLFFVQFEKKFGENDKILINSLKSLIEELVKIKKEYIIEDYINGVESSGYSDNYIRKWINDYLNKIKEEKQKSIDSFEKDIDKYISGELLTNNI